MQLPFDIKKKIITEYLTEKHYECYMCEINLFYKC